jgi:hypothetical protein
MMFQDNNSISRVEYWEDYSEDSEYSRERRGDPKHNRGRQYATEKKGTRGAPPRSWKRKKMT